ncbi:MAG: SDR family oxidoreductase [Neisseriaceae bacterium]|nr:SDR family oxidoreductase [Neisseriaceae bacterium]MBP6861310.1 SDR family oxidoreductase [Neisseriaceae bacterium]
MQKSIFITGCSSGIGLVAALDLQQRGYRVLAGCRQQQDVVRMNDLGLEGVWLDLDSEASVEAAAAEVIEKTSGRLYALFNNAGHGVYGPLRSLSRTQLQQQFVANLFGVHQLTLLLLPAMLPHGEGRIIQTSSIMGLVTTPKRGAYAASKYALEAWSDALRMELHDSGIRVSLLEPGPLTTSFSQNVRQTQADQPVSNPGIARFLTLGPEAILPKLHHALESRRPKLRYPVTYVAHGLIALKWLLPGRWLDYLLRHQSGG